MVKKQITIELEDLEYEQLLNASKSLYNITQNLLKENPAYKDSFHVQNDTPEEFVKYSIIYSIHTILDR